MSTVQKHRFAMRFFAVVGVVAVAALAMTLVSQPDARADQHGGGVTQVGTYDLEQVFQTYPGRQELMEAFQEAQPQMAEAQQEGNHQRMQQIQQQLQQKQQEVIDKFYEDVEEQLPGIAEAANVQVVALEVAWTAEGIDTLDLTGQVVEALGGEVEEEPMLPPMPE